MNRYRKPISVRAAEWLMAGILVVGTLFLLYLIMGGWWS